MLIFLWFFNDFEGVGVENVDFSVVLIGFFEIRDFSRFPWISPRIQNDDFS